MPTARELATKQIGEDEGFSRWAAPCPAGYLTIGRGRNVHPTVGPGITPAEADYLLANDLEICEADLSALFPDWLEFSTQRQATLINLRFQLGLTGFKGFRKMIAAIKSGDWETAASELADSALMNQTMNRTSRRVRELEDG